MSTQGELYRAVLANPGEDTPRLMYADWLDEDASDRGHPTPTHRAEYIRLAIALDDRPPPKAVTALGQGLDDVHRLDAHLSAVIVRAATGDLTVNSVVHVQCPRGKRQELDFCFLVGSVEPMITGTPGSDLYRLRGCVVPQPPEWPALTSDHAKLDALDRIVHDDEADAGNPCLLCDQTGRFQDDDCPVCLDCGYVTPIRVLNSQQKQTTSGIPLMTSVLWRRGFPNSVKVASSVLSYDRVLVGRLAVRLVGTHPFSRILPSSWQDENLVRRAHVPGPVWHKVCAVALNDPNYPTCVFESSQQASAAVGTALADWARERLSIHGRPAPDYPE